jgi:hypothetical protein
MLAMRTMYASLVEELELDFSRACERLVRARRGQAEKDSLANRAAVAERLAIIDDILDLYGEVRTT